MTFKDFLNEAKAKKPGKKEIKRAIDIAYDEIGGNKPPQVLFDDVIIINATSPSLHWHLDKFVEIVNAQLGTAYTVAKTSEAKYGGSYGVWLDFNY